MARKKVRFIVSVGPFQHQIFSVGEGSEGSLTILLNRAARTDHPLYGPEPTVFDKTSIHVSEFSSGYCVTNEIVYKIGDSIKLSTIIDIDYGFAWLVFTRVSPGHWVPDGRRIGKGIIYHLVDYNPSSETLLTSVFVTDKSRPFSTYENPERFRVLHDFSKFRIIVYAVTIPSPAPFSGSIYQLPLGQEQWNKRELQHSTHRSLGIPLKLIPLVRNMSAWTLRQRLLTYVLRDFGHEAYLQSAKNTEFMSLIGGSPQPLENEIEFMDYLNRIFP